MIGDQVLADRKARGLSRREYVTLLGDPWTESKLNNVEAGRREVKAAEAPALERVLGTPVEASTTARAPRSASGSVSAVAPTFPQHQQAAPISNYHDTRAQAVAAYSHVMQRLGGRPAPPFGLPSLYRVEECPPEDMPRWIEWCRRVNEWLDAAAAGSGIFADPNDATSYTIDEEEDVMFADVVSDPVDPAWFGAHGQGEAVTVEPTPPPVEVALVSQVAAPEPKLADILPFPVGYEEPKPAEGPVGVAALYDGKMRLMSNSEFQTFKHCRRRWWLGWYRGLKLKAEKPTGNMHLGTRVHQALAAWYVPEGMEQLDPREAFEKIVSADETRVVQHANSDSDTLIANLAEYKKEADLGRAMIEGYMEWIAETGIDSQYEVIAPEMTLQAVIKAASNYSFTLTGQLDVRVRRTHDGANLFMDHKTVGDLESPKLRLRLDEQMKTYLLLEEEVNETHVEGGLYNMLRRSKRTERAKPPFYERVEITHNPKVIKEFKERIKGEGLTVNHVEKCLKEGVDPSIIAYPSPSDACRWKCEFTALCAMIDDGSRAEDFISEHYVTVNPTAYRDAKKQTGEV